MEHATTTEQGREQARVRALDSLQLMGTAPEERFDRITRIARELFDVPIAALNLLDERELFVKSPGGARAATRPRAETFCDVTIKSPELLVVPDAATDPRFESYPDVAGGSGVRFYAGRPLALNGGDRVGTLCLFDTKARELSAADLGMLDELGAWAEAELQDSLDLDHARDVQQALLPATSPGAPAYEIAGACLPARAVGGDFYTWTDTGDGLEVTLADVMGKGAAAALMAATVRATLLSVGTGEPSEVIRQAAAGLGQDLDATGVFATAFQARLVLDSGRLDYADAGHGLALIVAPDGTHRQLRAPGLPLGLGGSGSWTSRSTQLDPEDVLIVFTDGLLDLFGGTLEALSAIAGLVHDNPRPAALIEAVRNAAAGKQEDDITVVALRRAS